MTKLYHHKTDGGAEYLTDTFIAWKHNGKSGKEGTITHETKICVRLDGQPELLGTMQADNAALIIALERVKLVLQDLRNGRRGGGVMGDASIALDYVDAALAQAEG